jgi:O-succinylbenzoate synthase
MLREVELRRVRLPLVLPFRTANDTTVTKDALLVRVRTVDADGWGECGAQVSPTYLAETIDTARLVLRDHLVPRAFAGASFEGVRGNTAAKAALECALLDAKLRAQGVPLARWLGGERTHVDAGVAVGMVDDDAELVDLATAYVDQGYRRIKLKIEPGGDIQPIAAVRSKLGDGIALQADANGTYTLDDIDRLTALDEYALQCIEQPLPSDALSDHATLASRLRTPICLDESISTAHAAADAIAMGACAVVNVKAARLGGLEAARRVHDVCAARDTPTLAGGMLETGIGRAALVALASLPNFTIPGDLSASDRYFAHDIVTEPFELDAGRLRVPTAPGLGVDTAVDVLDRCTIAREVLTAA